MYYCYQLIGDTYFLMGNSSSRLMGQHGGSSHREFFRAAKHIKATTSDLSLWQYPVSIRYLQYFFLKNPLRLIQGNNNKKCGTVFKLEIYVHNSMSPRSRYSNCQCRTGTLGAPLESENQNIISSKSFSVLVAVSFQASLHLAEGISGSWLFPYLDPT